MAFSKMYKGEGSIGWRKVRLEDKQVEQLRVEQIGADLDLYALILAKTKQKFPTMHVLSQERVALAVFEKKADMFYTEVQNLLDDLIDVERGKLL